MESKYFSWIAVAISVAIVLLYELIKNGVLKWIIWLQWLLLLWLQ